MRRRLFVVLAAFLAVPLFAQEEGTGEAKGAAVDTTGKGYTAAYVIEPKSGRVLFAENENVPYPTASMAKMMTLLITMEEIRDGRLDWLTPVTVSARASKMGGSQVYLKAGTVWPVKNLVIATMVQSANDAAQALAEKIAGSGEAFADLMNRRAEELGLKNSRFYDAHGLPNSENPEQIDTMSAHDLAILGQELMKHPFMRALAVVAEMPFRNGTLEKIYNPNRMVNPRSPDYYDAATGIKTGYSGPAGYCITASAKRGDLELVAVVMGARRNSGPLSSFGIAARLFNQAFAEYRPVVAVKKGAVVGQATVLDGRVDSVPVVAAEDAKALLKRGEDKNLKPSFAGATVKAPVRKGQPVGTITVLSGKNVIAKVPALAAEDVPAQAWWKKFWPF